MRQRRRNRYFIPLLALFLPSLLSASTRPTTPEYSTREETILSLIEALKDPSTYIQSEAMFLLEKIGKPAIPYFLKYTDSENPAQKWRILHLLAKNKVKKVIPILKKNIETSLNNHTWMLFYSFIQSLGYVGGVNEVAFILNEKNSCKNAMGLMALHKIAKRNLRVFLEGVYQEDKSYYHSETILGDVIKNLSLTPQIIISLFNEKHPAYQTGALFILRHIGKTGVASFLEKGLLSPYLSVQYQAIRGVDDFKVTRLLPKVISIIHPEMTPEMLGAASHAVSAQLNQLKPEESAYIETKMLKLLVAQKNELENFSIGILTQLKSKKPAQYLIDKLGKKNIPIHTQNAILYYLGLTAPENAEGVILPFLEPSATEDAALNALLQLRSEKVTDIILKKLTHKNTALEKQKNLIAMIRHIEPAKVSEKLTPILIKKLKNKKTDDDVIRQLIPTLAHLSPPNVEEVIFPFLTYKNFAYPVLEALCQLKPPYIETLLISFLSHHDLNVKILAIQELGKLKSKKSVNFLVQYLSYENSGAINEVIKSLALIGDQKAASPITLTLLNSQNPTIINNALSALAQLKDPSSIQYVFPYLEHENLSIRKTAAIAVKNLKEISK